MEEINQKINMSSHSGAVIEVVKEEQGTFVYKSINDDVPRTVRSLEKQKNFAAIDTIEYKIQATPINYWQEPDRLIAKMPYIEGISGAQISSHGNKALAKNIRLSLNNFFIDAIANSKEVQISNRIFLDKIDEIRSRPHPLEISESLTAAINWIESNIQETLNIPVGRCHGDLTLSNMIITQSHELYLLDFLDSYIETPLQDAAKIFQDMIYGWSFRNETSALRLRSQLFCESAFPDYLNILERIYQREMPIFKLMTVLRIAPYISDSDQKTVDWFNRAIKQILGSL